MQACRAKLGDFRRFCWLLAAGCQPGADPITSNGGTGGTGGSGAGAGTSERPERREVAPARPGRAASWGQAVRSAGTAGASRNRRHGRRDRPGGAAPPERPAEAAREPAAARPAAAAPPETGGTTGAGGSGSGTLTLTGLTIEANPKSVLSCFVNWTTSQAATSVVQFGVGKYEWEIADTAAVTDPPRAGDRHARAAGVPDQGHVDEQRRLGERRRDVHDRHPPRPDPGRHR